MITIDFDSLRIDNEELKERLWVVDNLEVFLDKWKEELFSFEWLESTGRIICNFVFDEESRDVMSNREWIDISIRGSDKILIRFWEFNSNYLEIEFIELRKGVKEKILNENIKQALLIHGITQDDIFYSIKKNITRQSKKVKLEESVKKNVENILDKNLDKLLASFILPKRKYFYYFIISQIEWELNDETFWEGYTINKVKKILITELNKKSITVSVSQDTTDAQHLKLIAKQLLENE